MLTALSFFIISILLTVLFVYLQFSSELRTWITPEDLIIEVKSELKHDDGFVPRMYLILIMTNLALMIGSFIT